MGRNRALCFGPVVSVEELLNRHGTKHANSIRLGLLVVAFILLAVCQISLKWIAGVSRPSLGPVRITFGLDELCYLPIAGDPEWIPGGLQGDYEVSRFAFAAASGITVWNLIFTIMYIYSRQPDSKSADSIRAAGAMIARTFYFCLFFLILDVSTFLSICVAGFSAMRFFVPFQAFFQSPTYHTRPLFPVFCTLIALIIALAGAVFSLMNVMAKQRYFGMVVHVAPRRLQIRSNIKTQDCL